MNIANQALLDIWLGYCTFYVWEFKNVNKPFATGFICCSIFKVFKLKKRTKPLDVLENKFVLIKILYGSRKFCPICMSE